MSTPSLRNRLKTRVSAVVRRWTGWAWSLRLSEERLDAYAYGKEVGAREGYAKGRDEGYAYGLHQGRLEKPGPLVAADAKAVGEVRRLRIALIAAVDAHGPVTILPSASMDYEDGRPLVFERQPDALGTVRVSAPRRYDRLCRRCGEGFTNDHPGVDLCRRCWLAAVAAYAQGKPVDRAPKPEPKPAKP